MKNRVNLSLLKGKKAQRTWLILVIALAFVAPKKLLHLYSLAFK
jgi:hypothetical protein